jgi:hypothetical protein
VGLDRIHFILGSVVFLAYLVLTVLNLVRLSGRSVPFAAPLSRIAALLLLVQYVVGFLLLGAGAQITILHYVLALLALVTVGLEHGFAPSRATPRERAVAALVATLGTTILIGAAHAIGSANDPAQVAAAIAAWR